MKYIKYMRDGSTEEKTTTATRTRAGKTAKDHKSGSWQNRFHNQKAREEWQKDRRAK